MQDLQAYGKIVVAIAKKFFDIPGALELRKHAASVQQMPATCMPGHAPTTCAAPAWPPMLTPACPSNVADIEDYYRKDAPKPLIFSSFARGQGGKVYDEVTDFKRLTRTLTEVGEASRAGRVAGSRHQ